MHFSKNATSAGQRLPFGRLNHPIDWLCLWAVYWTNFEDQHIHHVLWRLHIWRPSTICCYLDDMRVLAVNSKQFKTIKNASSLDIFFLLISSARGTVCCTSRAIGFTSDSWQVWILSVVWYRDLHMRRQTFSFWYWARRIFLGLALIGMAISNHIQGLTCIWPILKDFSFHS